MTTEQIIRVVRLIIRDKPKPLRNIQIGVGDGAEDIFRVPILTVNVLVIGDPDLTISLFDPNTGVYADGVISNFDYETGDVQLSSAPNTGVVVLAYFSYVIFTDDEFEMVLSLDEIVNCHYLAAAFCLQSIINDTSRLVSFSQGDAKYDFNETSKRIERAIERLWKQSPVTGSSIAVPFCTDVLSRLDYVVSPIVRANSPYARF